MKVVFVSSGQIFLANLKKGFFGRQKEIIISSLKDKDSKRDKVILLVPAEYSFIIQESKVKDSNLPESAERHISSLAINKNQALIYSSKINKETSLITIIDKAKLSNLWQRVQSLNLNIAGLILEPIAIYKLSAGKVDNNHKFLIVHVGQNQSSVYVIDKLAPYRVLPEVINTAELIPKTQQILKDLRCQNIDCQQGIFFGEDSLAFDAKIFEQQTQIKLFSAEKILLSALGQLKVKLADTKNLNKLTALIAAVLLLEKKEIVKFSACDFDSFNKKKEEQEQEKEAEPIVVGKLGLPNIRLVLLSIGIALIVAGVVLGALRLLGSKEISKDKKILLLPSPTATPTTVQKVLPKDVKTRILNGSGVIGVAGEIREILISDDFDVIDVDNADSFNYEKSELHYKKGSGRKVELVKKALEGKILIASVEASLSSDDGADVEVIVGKE